MAVAYDAFSSATAGTGNLSWTHTPSGTPKGVLVFVVTNSGSDEVTRCTYGGVPLALVAGKPNLHTTGEPGTVHAFFGGFDLPTGAQTVVVTVSGATSKRAGCITVTASTNTTVVNASDFSINSDSTSNPSATLNINSISSFVAIGFHSGQNAASGTTPSASWTARLEHDFGSQMGCWYTYDTIGTSNVACGWTQSAEDACMVAVAVSESSTTKTVMRNLLLPLTDLGMPLLRNTNNTSDIHCDKAGPQTIIRVKRDLYKMFFEAIDTGFVNTLAGKAEATSLQGPWTVTPTTFLNDGAAGWENDESSTTDVLWDGGRLIVIGHGGNNAGPRQCGVMYSQDGTVGESFVDEAANPIIVIGGGGSWDADRVCDWHAKYRNGSILALFRGASAGGVHGVGRATGNTWTTLTKYGSNPVISGLTGSKWRALNCEGGGFVIDPDSRIHLALAGCNTGVSGEQAIGWLYSDDDGITWTEGPNPVAERNTSAGSPTRGIGDVNSVFADDDILFVTTGIGNTTDYATNPPLRGIGAYITPYRKVNPARTGKFYVRTSSARTEFTGKTGVLSQSTFTVCGRFRAFRLDRLQPRHIYTENAAFNIEHFVRIENGASAGKLSLWYRTPSGIIDIKSTSTYDDSLWHRFMVVRTSSTNFELWVDGTNVATSDGSVNPSTDATSSTKAVGNWHSASGNPDEAFDGTISDLVTVNGSALSWDQALEMIERRSGATAHISFPSEGTDKGDTAKVDATADTNIISTFPHLGAKRQNVLLRR